jgi:hypothetical protein
MHSVIISIIVLINISLLFAMPSSFIYQDDDDIEMHHLARRFKLSLPWIRKRNQGLCDYRLQLRPLPFTSTLCTYG